MKKRRDWAAIERSAAALARPTASTTPQQGAVQVSADDDDYDEYDDDDFEDYSDDFDDFDDADEPDAAAAPAALVKQDSDVARVAALIARENREVLSKSPQPFVGGGRQQQQQQKQQKQHSVNIAVAGQFRSASASPFAPSNTLRAGTAATAGYARTPSPHTMAASPVPMQMQQQPRSPRRSPRKEKTVALLPERTYKPIVKRRVSKQEAQRLEREKSRVAAVLEQVHLTSESFDLFEMTPVSQLDMLKRDVSRGVKHNAAVQYNDDWVDMEVQTDAAESNDVAVQYPEDSMVSDARGHSLHLARFVRDAGRVVEQLLSESSGRTGGSTDGSNGGDAHESKLASAAETEAAIAEDDRALSTKSVTLSAPWQELLSGRDLRDMCVPVPHAAPAPALVCCAYAPLPRQEPSAKRPAERKSNGDAAGGGDDDDAAVPTVTSADIGNLIRSRLQHKGLVLVWDMERAIGGANDPPMHVLVCDGEPTCCSFAPERGDLVIAGMASGSLALWDLREPAMIHHRIQLHHEWSAVLRYPTFSTDHDVRNNHTSPCVSIEPVYVKPRVAVHANENKDSDNTSSNSNNDNNNNNNKRLDVMSVALSLSSRNNKGRSTFQVASVDARGRIIVWTVVQIARSADAQYQQPSNGASGAASSSGTGEYYTRMFSGSTSELGLRAGGRVKLIQSSSLDSGHGALADALCMSFLPNDTNEVLVAHDDGRIVRVKRFGDLPPVASYDAGVAVQRISFSPFASELFLASCRDGSVCLFHIDDSQPSHVWAPGSVDAGNSGGCQAWWSLSRPLLLHVLDGSGRLSMRHLVHPRNTSTADKALHLRQAPSTTGLRWTQPFARRSSGKHDTDLLLIAGGSADQNMASGVQLHAVRRVWSERVKDEMNTFTFCNYLV